MQSIKDILKKFNPLEDKYVSREFQSFGVYMKLAKTIHRPILEEALRFTVDSRARNKGALFMWKLKELGAFAKKIH